ncbi:hypothetical protein PVAP13_6KG109948 [Panicum virgatum]|uniref:Uncharacterized protein n=1 Tax=Panicum virgatum TaxID=38727 RepID=A0A8T0R9J0_PANVG|nr:hypothetical protein PVAP13_6KG109948 [Panicum virgatum]
MPLLASENRGYFFLINPSIRCPLKLKGEEEHEKPSIFHRRCRLAPGRSMISTTPSKNALCEPEGDARHHDDVIINNRRLQRASRGRRELGEEVHIFLLLLQMT